MNTLLPKSELNLSSSSIEDSLNSIHNHIRQIDKNVEEHQRKELQEINLSYKNNDERMIKINKWIKRTNGNLPPSLKAEFNQIQITNKYLEKRLKNIDKEIDEYRKEQTDYYSIEIESEVERIKYTLTDYLGMVIPFEISHYYQMVKFESDLLDKIKIIDRDPRPEEPTRQEVKTKVGCLFMLTFFLLCIPFSVISMFLVAGVAHLMRFGGSSYLLIIVFVIAGFFSWITTKKVFSYFAVRKATRDYELEKRNWEIEVKNFNEEKKNTRAETVQKLELVHSCLERYRQGDTSIIEDFICTTLEQLPRVRQGSSVISVNFSNSSVVVDYLLPDIDDIRELPIDVTIKQGDFSFSYFKDSQLSKAYNKLVYDIILAVMNCVFNYDEVEDIESVTVNGILDTVDKSVGKNVKICACSLQMGREEFSELNLELIDSYECFRRFKGVAAANIADKVAVRPIQQIQDKDRRFVEGYCVASELQRGTNLATMPWQDFENLIRELFEKLFSKHGGSCKVTRASRDGGVDAVAFNPDPISGGKFIIQAKRYTNLVSPSAVRDLYGTLQHEGANKAILVTTSDYGGDSYSFAKDKPIQLLNGSHLLHYLKEELGMTDVYINLEEAKKLQIKLLGMSQSLVSDIATESEWIAPFFCYYPERENLNSKQAACYKKIKVELDRGRFVDVGDNQSYIFLYINEVLKKVKKKKDVANIVTVLESLRALYKGDELLIFFIEHWLADSYVLQGKYNEAMELYKLRDHVDALWSLKNKLNIPLSLKDLPAQLWKNNYTCFVNDKLEQVNKYLELAIKEKGYDNNWIQEIIKRKTEKLGLAEDKKIMEYPLFRATRYGYHLNKLNKDIQFVYYSEIIGRKKLEKICKELSREAENLLRVALGIPRVGEGWVSETALYYKVKEFLSDYEVVHHYRAEWLGRQHLDIYIPKLSIGIEYQGEQHFKPIDIFGGLDAFLKNQKRDAEKREKCKKVNVTLIEVLPNYDFESVKYEIRKHMPI